MPRVDTGEHLDEGVRDAESLSREVDGLMVSTMLDGLDSQVSSLLTTTVIRHAWSGTTPRVLSISKVYASG